MVYDKTCRHWMPRAKKTCLLLKGHKGCHRNASVWYCDTCNEPRTGFPAGRDSEAGVVSCFMCMLHDLKYMGQVKRRKHG